MDVCDIVKRITYRNAEPFIFQAYDLAKNGTNLGMLCNYLELPRPLFVVFTKLLYRRDVHISYTHGTHFCNFGFRCLCECGFGCVCACVCVCVCVCVCACV